MNNQEWNFGWTAISSIGQILAAIATIWAVLVALKPFRTKIEVLFVLNDYKTRDSLIRIINHSSNLIVIKEIYIYDNEDVLTFIDYYNFHSQDGELKEINPKSIGTINISPYYLIHHYGHGIIKKLAKNKNVIVEVTLSNGYRKKINTGYTFSYISETLNNWQDKSEKKMDT